MCSGRRAARHAQRCPCQCRWANAEQRKHFVGSDTLRKTMGEIHDIGGAICVAPVGSRPPPPAQPSPPPQAASGGRHAPLASAAPDL
mmetsp:Transcript_51809/g.119089  ORF Transcript_51809/g.119089 Transcript_51809/m.119089 type:complete len:87 (-) Transcript_51809:91-351(-)